MLKSEYGKVLIIRPKPTTFNRQQTTDNRQLITDNKPQTPNIE